MLPNDQRRSRTAVSSRDDDSSVGCDGSTSPSRHPCLATTNPALLSRQATRLRLGFAVRTYRLRVSLSPYVRKQAFIIRAATGKLTKAVIDISPNIQLMPRRR